jgi:hypothetical protein
MAGVRTSDVAVDVVSWPSILFVFLPTNLSTEAVVPTALVTVIVTDETGAPTTAVTGRAAVATVDEMSDAVFTTIN